MALPHQLSAAASCLSSSHSAFVSNSHQLFTPTAITSYIASPTPLLLMVSAEHTTDGGAMNSNTDALHRRQLLIASTSLGTAASLPHVLSAYPALGSPVQPPDFKKCVTPIEPGNGAPSVDCCLPPSKSISDYKIPQNLPLRTRLSAHQVSQGYIAKYNKAYQLLRQLPATDPRTYALQANAHCAFCDAAYDEAGTQMEYQVHNSWLFFPWHRWYLYFHERILATLIQDDSFALSFWNWDDASGYTIPPMYTSSQSSLYDSKRNPAHLPPTVVDLNYNFTESNLSPSAQLSANNTLMYRQMVTNSKTPSLFFGQAYRQGDAASPGAGTIENVPHGTVHTWTGNPANPNDEDMGALYSAGRDPIFFAHHSNIDRLWEVWKSLGGRRKDIKDSDYLNATFLFYDENAKLVRVRIGDALDPTKLGYRYSDVSISWLNAAPKTRLISRLRSKLGGGVAMAGQMRDKIKEELREFKERTSKKLDKIERSLVKRRKKVKAEDYEEEVLVFEGVELPSDEKVKFDVYINLPEEEAGEKAGCDSSEYAGSFFNVPHLGMKDMQGIGKRVRRSNFRIGIGDVLKELGIEDDDSFSITIVQRTQTSFPVSIDDVKLEYE